MPVDLSVPNSIIAAFNTGFQEKQTEAQRKQQKELEKARLQQQKDEATARLEEQQKEFNVTHAATKALNELQMMHEKQGILKSAEDTGTAPEGSTLTGSYFDPTDTTLQYRTFSHPLLGEFKVPEKLFHAQEQAQANEALNEPIIAREKAKQEEEGKRQLANIKAQDEEKRYETNLRYQTDLQRTQETNALRLEIAKLNNSSKSEVQQLRNEMNTNRLLSPEEANQFGVPYGTTRSDVFGKTPGVKLTADQEAKLASLDDLENKAVDFKNSLSKGGLAFYQGLSVAGGINELTKGISGKEDIPVTKDGLTLKDIRTKAANLNSTVAEERFKSRFTPSEAKQLSGYIPTDSRTEPPDSVTSKINNLVKSIGEQRASLLKSITGKYVDQNDKPIASTKTKKPVRIKVDAQGNEIQ